MWHSVDCLLLLGAVDRQMFGRCVLSPICITIIHTITDLHFGQRPCPVRIHAPSSGAQQCCPPPVSSMTTSRYDDADNGATRPAQVLRPSPCSVPIMNRRFVYLLESDSPLFPPSFRSDLLCPAFTLITQLLTYISTTRRADEKPLELNETLPGPRRTRGQCECS